MKYFLTAIILAFISIDVCATHVVGSNITYKWLDSVKLEITVSYYRDCRGVGLSNPSSSTRIRCLNGSTASLNLNLVGIYDVSQYVDSTAGCNPVNTYNSGNGIEKHVYNCFIDLNDSPYQFLKSCCEAVIETGQCCRSSSINTGASNANFYNYTYMNLCNVSGNNSVEFTLEPIAITCCNQPVFNNIAAVDTVDFDSISYSFGEVLSGWNQNVSYSGVYYTYNHPFQVYYPGSLSPPYKNPNANPPIGIYLDPQSGDLIYTPTRCDEVTVAVIEASEWRRDTSGTYKLIGKVRMDQMYYTKACPTNNPPMLEGPYSYTVCEGDSICFDITSDDPVFVPPPPNPVPPSDSVRLRWNYGIPAGHFSITDSTAKLQTGRFCWQPQIGDAKTFPYVFAVIARDNSQPINAMTSRSFSIRVISSSDIDYSRNKISCNSYEINCQPDPTQYPIIEILDSLGNALLSNPSVYFRSSNNVNGRPYKDTLILDSIGYFVLRVSEVRKCANTIFDTIIVSDLLTSTPVITKVGGWLYSSMPNVSWYRNDTFLVKADSISTTELGIYKARYDDGQGCISLWSNEIGKTASFGELEMNSILIYPNPSTGSVMIRNESGSDIQQLELSDINGKRMDVSVRSNGNIWHLNWSGDDGMYYLKIITEYNSFTKAVLKTGSK